MIERLEIINKRYEELNKQLLDPENLSNIKLTREISKEISDLEAVRLVRDIRKKIEDELDYPGNIKVTVIRETRATDYAK